jgi:hypothetical protein
MANLQDQYFDSDDIYTIDALLASPSSNDPQANSSTIDNEIKKDTERAKTQGLNNLIDVIEKINKVLDNKNALEIRQYVRKYKDLHSLLESRIEKLKYFQPISEYIGSEFLAYTPDKSSLQLEKWSNSTIGSIFTPTAIRKNLKGKIRSELYNEIETSYINLNIALKSNIPNEFLVERTTNQPQQSPLSKFAHGYHIAGDFSFLLLHMNSSKPNTVIHSIEQAFNDFLQEQVQQINYYYPISEETAVSNTAYTTSEEQKTVEINNKKDLAINPFTKVNNDALKPVQPKEN